LRKSTIGLELATAHGLLEWFLSQKGAIKGYRKAIYSGLISLELAHLIEEILMKHVDISGIWNVSSRPINKFDLLMKIKERLGREDIEIIPDDEFECDRSLNGSRFEKETGYRPPSWDQMVESLALEIEERY
jgi:dTDP-4-dehydrorhamnose reductase